MSDYPFTVARVCGGGYFVIRNERYGLPVVPDASESEQHEADCNSLAAMAQSLAMMLPAGRAC